MISTTTHYTKKLLKDFQNVLFTQRFRKIRWYELGFLVLLYIYNMFVNQKPILFVLLYLFALMIIIEAGFRFSAFRTFMKWNPSFLNHSVSYEFQKEQVHISSNKSDFIFRYAQLHQVIEAGQALFLFENKKEAYLVDISTLQDEEVETIKQWLYQKRVTYKKNYNVYL